MSNKRPPYVEWVANDFLSGIAGLGIVEIGVYTVIINLIYDKGGPIPDDRARLARRCGCRIDHFNKALEELIRIGKVRAFDGVLSNDRCEATILKRTQKIESYLSRFGSSASEIEEKPNDRNGHEKPAEVQTGTSNGVHIKIQNKTLSERGRKSPAQPAPARAKAAARGSRIDPNWQPSTEQILFARQQGLTDRETSHEAKKFVAHYLRATGRWAISASWDASWQGWVLNAVERLGRNAAPVQAQASRRVDPSSYSREEWSTVIKVYGTTGSWNTRNGPPPGEPGCLCPKDLVREFVNHS